jgi:hypothetical protein
MKKTFITGLSLVIFILSNAFAQKSENKNESDYKFSNNEAGETHLSPGSYSMSSPGSSNISEKVLKHFNKKYNNATQVKWYQFDDSFLATFSTGGTLTRSLFDKKGRMIYSINYFSEKQLPADVKKMITNRYESYKITGAAKVLQDNRKIWVIKLADEFNYVTARLEDGEIEETEIFRKL